MKLNNEDTNVGNGDVGVQDAFATSFIKWINKYVYVREHGHNTIQANYTQKK